MAMNSMKRTITCFCENQFEAEIPETIDLAAEPGVRDDVLEGRFMAVSCPLCGKRLTPEFPCRFYGAPGDREIFFVPELDRVTYLMGKLPYEVGSPWRVVIGFPELAEKFRVLLLDLDDRVIEIMKYYLLTRPAQGEVSGGEEVIARFSSADGERLVFQVEGLREGQIAVAKLARDVYGRILTDVEKKVEEDPFKEFCEAPYVSVRRIG
jgi:hypothetical protein